jgi:glycosyltransferase involved in cell wall biosynthesis
VEHIAWSEATETSIIRTFDIGVMPLRDEPYAWGKSGLKLIQYMGCAVPAVGSAIGANRRIIRDGVNGFLASCGEEFVHKIEALIGENDLRMRLGQAGRRTVEDRYSLQATAPRFCELLTEIVTCRSNAPVALPSVAEHIN